MCMAPETHGISHPLPGVGFSCFACLKQTTTSVFSSCFVCGMKKKQKKIRASVKNNCIAYILLDLLAWNGRAIGRSRQRRGQDVEQLELDPTYREKVMRRRKKMTRMYVRSHVHTHTYLKQRRIGFLSGNIKMSLLCSARLEHIEV